MKLIFFFNRLVSLLFANEIHNRQCFFEFLTLIETILQNLPLCHRNFLLRPRCGCKCHRQLKRHCRRTPCHLIPTSQCRIRFQCRCRLKFASPNWMKKSHLRMNWMRSEIFCGNSVFCNIFFV